MSRIRIAYINNTCDVLGGAERSLLDLISHIDKTIYEPVVILPGTGSLSEALSGQGVKIDTYDIPVLENKIRFLWRSYKFAKYLKQLDIALIHGNSLAVLDAVSFARRFSGIPAVCHIRNMPPDWLVKSKRYKSFAKYIDGLLATSNAVADKLREINEAYDKVLLLHNAIDFEAIEKSISDIKWRETTGISEDAVCFGFVGRLHPEKGIEELLEAFALLSLENENVFLVIIGSDRHFKESSERNYLDELKFKTKQLEIFSRVRFTGFRKDIFSIIRELDIIVIPSWMEGFGRAAVEAMACSKPVIATDVGGLRDIVEDGVNGILVPPHNAGAIIDAMRFMLSDKAVREKMGEAGRLLAEEKFSYKKYMPVLETCYEAVLKKS